MDPNCFEGNEKFELLSRFVGKSTVHRSGLTPLRAQISNNRLVYCRVYPLVNLHLSLSALIIHLDSAKIKNQLWSVPVGMPAVPDTWVSIAISPVGIPELHYMRVLATISFYNYD